MYRDKWVKRMANLLLKSGKIILLHIINVAIRVAECTRSKLSLNLSHPDGRVRDKDRRYHAHTDHQARELLLAWKPFFLTMWPSVLSTSNGRFGVCCTNIILEDITEDFFCILLSDQNSIVAIWTRKVQGTRKYVTFPVHRIPLQIQA